MFGTGASLVRRFVLQRAVRHYTGLHFPARGLFVEAGCGTGEASAGVALLQRRLLALDVSLAALLLARQGGTPYRYYVAADLRRLPFADESIAGAWNLGVMEHFAAPEGGAVLRELRRFFEDYKALEHKQVVVEDLLGPAEAVDVILAALDLYRRMRRGEVLKA